VRIDRGEFLVAGKAPTIAADRCGSGLGKRVTRAPAKAHETRREKENTEVQEPDQQEPCEHQLLGPVKQPSGGTNCTKGQVDADEQQHGLHRTQATAHQQMVNVAAIGRGRVSPADHAPDGDGEKIQQHNADHPEHRHRWRRFSVALRELDRKPRNHNPEHLASCVTHERAGAATEQRRVERKKPHQRTDHHDEKLHRVRIAEHPSEKSEVTEDCKYQGARQSVEAIKRINGVDDRNCCEHGQRDRPVHQLDRTSAEEITERMQEVITPGGHQHGRQHLHAKLGARKHLATIIKNSDDCKDRDGDQEHLIVSKRPQGEREGQEQAQREGQAARQRCCGVVTLASAGMIDQPQTLSGAAHPDDHQAGGNTGQ